jgi:hypothetical protein
MRAGGASLRVDEHFRLVADSYDLADRGRILDGLDHEVGYIGARDFETEKWQMAFSHAVLSRVRPVGQLGRAHHRPVEFAFREGCARASAVR